MQLQTLASTIQLIIAPVVMVSACAILLGGLLSRYAAINDRLRLMARERLDLLRAAAQQPLDRERLEEIDDQIPLLVRHHRLAHHAVLAVYIAVAIFILDMFAIALAAVMYIDAVGVLVMLLFVGGMSALLVGAVLTAQEVRTSHQAIHYEVMRILSVKPNADR